MITAIICIIHPVLSIIHIVSAPKRIVTLKRISPGKMMRFAKDGFLAQTGQAMLSQAGRDPECVLKLLR